MLVVSTLAYIERELKIIDAPDFPTDGIKTDVAIVGMGPPQAAQRLTQAGTKLFGMQFESPAFHVAVEANFNAEMAFEEYGPLKVVNIDHALTALCADTRQIVGKFDSEF